MEKFTFFTEIFRDLLKRIATVTFLRKISYDINGDEYDLAYAYILHTINYIQ